MKPKPRAGDLQPKIIAIGASLGGAEALSAILPALPEGYPFPVVVVLHRHKDSGHTLAGHLQRSCSMPVVEAEDKMEVEPGCVYLAPADYHLLIERGTRNSELGTGEIERGTRKSERGTGEIERGTRKSERGTGEIERGTRKSERGTGAGERGTSACICGLNLHVPPPSSLVIRPSSIVHRPSSLVHRPSSLLIRLSLRLEHGGRGELGPALNRCAL
ncbi:MAG: chemotaxis protein CheB [Thermodesulfobacteriota bacterium]